MARKGTARVKPHKDKYLTDSESNSDGDDDFTLDGTACEKATEPRTAGEEHMEYYNVENVDPNPAREQLNLPKAPKQSRRDSQPRQGVATTEQSKTLAADLFPSSDDVQSPPRPSQTHKYKKLHPQHLVPANLTLGKLDPYPTGRIINRSAFAKSTPQVEKDFPILTHNYKILEKNVNMAIPGGAAIPANQQKNMRACMVCSIVRTQQQFMTSGCPNCEDILELAGNSEQINDCTSQVFDGLISVADTKKSWVARYQRLEGYVPGVYATQVEGILPEDVIVAVENAGIIYVPRDGSEQDMLPKD